MSMMSQNSALARTHSSDGQDFSAAVLHNNISSLAQESLGEVRKLRIFLSRLLNNAANQDNDVEDADKIPDEALSVPKPGMSKSGSVSGPLCVITDGKSSTHAADGKKTVSATSAKAKQTEKLMVHKIIGEIRDVFYNLDQLASRMHNSRLSSRPGDIGLQNALSIFTTVEQLEFSRNTTPNNLPFSQPTESESEMRRVDWLTDRVEAERWSHRYWQRTRAVLEGLLACAVFRRSHLTLDHMHRRADLFMTFNRDCRPEFEHLLNNLQFTLPDLAITLVEPASVVNVVHLRVGEVMQCFVTFRQLNPEKIIVRGISEPMLITKWRNSSDSILDTDVKTLSSASEDLLNGKIEINASPQVRDVIVNLLNPDPKCALAGRSQRTSAPVNNQRRIRTCNINFQSLDLFTSSRHTLYQRISSLAQCALLHFANEYKPPSAVRGLFTWLHNYRDLFNAPCSRCGQLLGQNVELPVWRSYSKLRKDDLMEPMHEHCQAIV